MYLSKSDFQLASSCPQKILYKKRGYPTSNDSNEYMKLLAEGGYIVGHMATMMYPQGIEITGNTEHAIEITRELLQHDEIVLFEAAIQAGQKLIRIDILTKKGNDFDLIEVKSKSDDSELNSNKGLEKYIEDVAYQYHVLSEAYPNMNITCSLLMPDKAKKTNIEGLAGWFSIERDERPVEPQQINQPRFRKPIVRFRFDDHPLRDHYLTALMNDGILTLKNVTEEVIKLQPEIENRANNLINILNRNSADGCYGLTKNCKYCEFRTPDEELNGFNECWGPLANTDPHIFDLYFGGAIGSKIKGYYLDELIEDRKTGLWDIDLERLKDSKGNYGTRGIRQLIQLENTRHNTEWMSNELRNLHQTFSYPYHFIDFETYLGAIPFHSNMRPYELLAFQWSVHTIERPGTAPIHREWIHHSENFPNFEFALSLMNAIGNNGTPFMWATHENTVLKTILDQMETYGFEHPQLKEWLTKMTGDKTLKREGRLIDMNKMTLDHYFHPLMKGKTSIKKVLPAIWETHTYLHNVPHFADYKATDLEGKVIDPYDTLAAHSDEDIGDEVVKVGTAAMRAYFRYRFDDSLSEEQKQEIKNQLLAYCRLDTLSMVVIAHHWGIK